MNNYIKLKQKKKERHSLIETSKLGTKMKNGCYKFYKKKCSNSPDINYDREEIMKKVKIDLLQKKENAKIVKIIKKTEDNKKEVSEYIQLQQLGKGASGICYLFESVEDGTRCAAKIVLKSNINDEHIRNEISLQQTFDHPKIVKVKKYTEDNDKVYILLELCKNKTLEHLIEKRKYLTEPEVQCYIFQLIQGLKYLHSKKIIHRDLKPSNIYLDEKLELKIGDFGLVGKMNSDNDRKTTVCGTPYYMAPEINNGNGKGYSFEVDIWSMGIIMYHLLTGQLPFEEKEKTKLYHMIVNDDFNFPEKPKISNIAQDLIRQILVKDPKRRPGLNQILYHDFFHIGKIPRFLNDSTLTNEPTIQEIRKYMPNADENGRVNKEVVNKCLYKIIPNNNIDIRYEDIDTFIDNDNQNIKGKDFNIRITTFHKSHYNFCFYEFNNNLKGIIFKKDDEDEKYEGIKLILNEMTEEFYEIKSDEEEKIQKYKVDKCPEHLKNYLKKFMKYSKKRDESKKSKESVSDINTEKEEDNSKDNSIIEVFTLSERENENENKKEENEEKNIIYIKNFNEGDYATFFELSNDNKQVNFKDGVKMIFSEKKGLAQYIDKNKKNKIISLVNIMQNENKKFTKRLRYIKNSNIKELNVKINSKSKKSSDMKY